MAICVICKSEFDKTDVGCPCGKCEKCHIAQRGQVGYDIVATSIKHNMPLMDFLDKMAALYFSATENFSTDIDSESEREAAVRKDLCTLFDGMFKAMSSIFYDALEGACVEGGVISPTASTALDDGDVAAVITDVEEWLGLVGDNKDDE